MVTERGFSSLQKKKYSKYEIKSHRNSVGDEFNDILILRSKKKHSRYEINI